MLSPTETILALTIAMLAGLLTNAVCEVVIRARFGLDEVSARSNHQLPTPRTGGFAILVTLAAATLCLSAVGVVDRQTWIVLGLMGAFGTLGLIDDFVPLPAVPRLFVMVLLSGITVFFLGPLATLPVPFVGWTELPYAAGFLLGVLWMVGLINVVNFMDGLNGLIGSFTVLALTMGVIAVGGINWPVLTAQLAVLGFLFANAFKGRVFLGDAGSLSLGFLIGAAALSGGTSNGQGFWLVALVCLPLIGDVALTLVRRAARGARITEPHREHLYQRMKAVGWSHQAVSLSVLATGLCAAVLGLNLRQAWANEPAVYWLSVVVTAAVWLVTMVGLTRLRRESDGLEGALR